MDSNIGKNIDRISNLPDALLCHILSFLPTKYAVGTSTLSTRWQYLWTSVPNLDFDDSKCFQEYARLSEDKRKEVDLSFQYFVNRVLLLSDAPCFQKFHLQIGGSLELLDLVDTWISAAVKRNVEDLNLINGFEINVRLPVRLFTSKTLVVLSLSGVLLDIPCSVWLPSLKSLRLDYVEYGDEDSLQEFLIGCPILEEMYIHRWTVDSQMVLNVSVPTLKRLTVFCYRDDFIDQLDDSDEPDDQGCKLVVDAPQLEYLYLADCVDILLRNLPSLSKASFFVRHVCLRRGSFIDGLRMYKLLSGITNVKVLEAHLATCFGARLILKFLS
ncbi:F-box/FBD/LRR-repeat protein At4g26340-like isoform X2 [Camellia sinensis]|uniref:F-box/FBD/LRR-repeat protein At4g26340-like isoform X2 n=1 Tax=Camellia sinensis TaxID=4442 RepID=UPI001036180F|nr:F-box/FBD/LRR-repeat protein At4g26340-like isoform X2 [Camellia sinensis]